MTRDLTASLASAVIAACSCLASCASNGTSASVPADDAGVDATAACTVPVVGLPTDVFCTGLYTNHDSKQHAPETLAYTPGVKLWSDGAEKSRFIAIPAGSTIDTSNLDAWSFPVGTKAWKEFRVAGVLVETRLFWKRTATSWESGTYIWDSTENSASLNTATKGIVRPDGYEIPTAKDCDKCHHGGADKLLGVEAVALALPAAQGATLTVLASKGLLSNPPLETTRALPEDATGKAGAALGFLHANCGMPCHSSRGLGDETKLVMRIRAGELWPTASDAGSAPGAGPVVAPSATDVYGATVNQAPTTAAVAHAFPGTSRITPGAHDKSLVWLVSHLRGNYQMPPLVSHKVDEVGTQQLAEWIDALPK